MTSANTGVGSHVPERFRTVVYATGTVESAQPLVARLTEYLSARYWELDGTFYDDDRTQPAAKRQGLAEALDRLRNGHATALLMSTDDYLAFTPTARQWLEIEVQRLGGFIQPLPPDESGSDTGADGRDAEPP